MTTHAGAKSVSTAPFPASALGYAGLIPFVGCALAVFFSPELKAPAAFALIAYGAVILSFLGGIRWGFAVVGGDGEGWSGYGLSVIPSLVAWLGVLLGGPEGLILLAASIVVWFFVERSATTILLPSWYYKLRAVLTAVATLSLLTAALSW